MSVTADSLYVHVGPGYRARPPAIDNRKNSPLSLVTPASADEQAVGTSET